MNAIDVKDLFFSYRDTPVLENISFSINFGEFVGIFGPNGGGKTTLLYLLMGFLKPSRGKIQILGKSVKACRKEIGWVPQNFYFDRFFPISVKEVVLEGRLAHLSWLGAFSSEDHKIVYEALDLVGMRPFLEYPFSALSGGQQQRVLIARALAGKPSFLFLDEPTASVDVAAQSEIYRTLRDLKGKMTILMVTHDLKNTLEAVDRLFCVQKQLSFMSKEKVCEHFALGLYHPVEGTK